MDRDLRPRKEPWLAVCFSWVVPGLGQLYSGAWVLGASILATWILLGVGAIWQLASADGSIVLCVLLAISPLAPWVLGVSLAHRSGRKANTPEAEQFRKQTKDPYLAVFLSLLFPGVGYLYLRRWVAGVLLIVATSIILVMSEAPVFFMQRADSQWKERLLVDLILCQAAWCIYKAAVCYLTYRRGPMDRKTHTGSVLAVCVLCVGMGLFPWVAAYAFREYYVEAFAMPTESMAPTIQPGDKILAWKRPFVPQHGDMVVFINPNDRNQNYVKRVAAVAGETIEFRRDGAYVDGALLDRRLFGGLPYEYQNPHPDYPQWANEGSPFTVPPDHVFVLGDNIERSFDSRHFGPVPISDIKGKVYKRYWPLNGAGPLE